MTVFDPKKNFAVSSVLVAPTPALTGTTLQVAAGEGSLFPAAGAGVSWNAIVFPANAAPSISNAEIVRVTSRVGEVFTITRTQEGSQARSIQVGDRIMNGFTVKTFTDIENAINAAGGATVLTAQPILEAGVLGQVRAGRVLTPSDFTTLMGLASPVGLFNLGDVSDLGSGGPLVNKGAVTFGGGIMGLTPEAAIFTGSTGQALYIADTGAADPFRIPYGSWGGWFRTAKSGVNQIIIAKATAAAFSYFLYINTANVVSASGTTVAGTGQQALAVGATNVCDDRWHHAAVTYDGTIVSLYIDGVLEAVGIATTPGPMIGAAAPLNIGAEFADGATAATSPFFGRIDEAFVTADVLSADQVRLLYAAEVLHSFGAVPLSAKVSVRRLKKGAALTSAMFSTAPLHLYNFTAGALTDQGSLGNALTNNNAATVAPGVDGAQGNAFNVLASSSQSLSASDAGLPAGTAARTLGIWMKAPVTNVQCYLMDYGTTRATNDVGLIVTSGGLGACVVAGTALPTVQHVDDGQWHYLVAVIDGAAADGLLTKLYLDGKLAASSAAALTATVLGGAGKFRIGSSVTPDSYFTGQTDAAFVTGYAMSADEVAKLYAVGAQSLGVSPKNAGAHVEAMDATSVYLIADTLESQHLLDLEVAG